jgi:density-regulated protein
MVESVVNNHFKDVDFLCQLCFFPKEYCEFSHDMLIKKKIAAKDKISEEKIAEKKNAEKHNENADADKSESKEVKNDDDKDKKLEPDNKEDKKEDEKKEKKNKKQKTENKVIIEESKRSKKKHITYVSNLEKFGHNLKDMSKAFSKKFACSANVSKEDNGQEIITMTGEFAYELQSFLIEKYAFKESDFKILASN